MCTHLPGCSFSDSAATLAALGGNNSLVVYLATEGGLDFNQPFS